MTILELIKNTNTDSILKAVKYFYPEDKNDYSSLIESFKQRQEVKDIKGIISVSLEGELDEEYYGVSYISNNNVYSTSFLDWDIYLNSNIDNKCLKYLLPEDFLAHIIWDITFYGIEEDMLKEKEELINQVAQVTKASS